MSRRLMCVALVLSVLGTVAYGAFETIVPGVLWYDTADVVLSAHGGGILKIGSTYYWFGEYKDSDPNNVLRSYMGHVTHQFVANTCYSSTDFVNWTFENNVLTQQASGDLGPGRVVERPKVIYNSSTGMYVMYMHIENNRYGDRRCGVATCPTVDGNYTYLRGFKPLGNDSKDMTLFKDDDGKAYLISGSINIYQLTSDYLDVNNLVVTINSPGAEAPAMFKTGGIYYLLTSNSTWWTPNDNYYHTAPAISGPWTNRGDFTPGSPNTWTSQTTFVQAIQGSSATTYVFLADRWVEGDFGNSTYIWLPLIVNGTTLTVNWYDSWQLDAQTGQWQAGAPDTTPPTPNPMTWAVLPYATSSSSIAMTATTATDVSGVEYFFDCTTAGGHDSAWQSGTTYTDTGLQPNTQYCYSVQARDKSANQNTTGWSANQCATTQSGGTLDMYVYDITMSSYSPKSNYYAARATVWIKDQNTANVSGATVTGNWSGASGGSSSGNTGADGKVTLESKSVKGGGTFTFTVTNVAATGYTYNPSLNIETSGTITAP